MGGEEWGGRSRKGSLARSCPGRRWAILELRTPSLLLGVRPRVRGWGARGGLGVGVRGTQQEDASEGTGEGVELSWEDGQSRGAWVWWFAASPCLGRLGHGERGYCAQCSSGEGG